MNISDAEPSTDPLAERPPDSGLTTTIHSNGDIVVLEVDGDVDMLTAPPLRDAIVKSIDDHPRMLIIDLSAVRFLGSSGLSLLVEARQLAGEDIRLRVVADGPTTRRPLQLTGLDEQFALYPTREAALRND